MENYEGKPWLLSRYALECKEKWCELILSGQKKLEVRSYPPPDGVAGQRAWLAATGGQEGVATLGDAVAAGDAAGRLLGWAVFSGCRLYEAAEPFAADEALHCIPTESPYGWNPGVTKALYGWEIIHHGRIEAPLPSMRRLHRSVYILEAPQE